MVLAAGQRGSDASAQALAELCGRYWYPLYGYVRRRVGNPEEARDLTQEFFARLLEKDVLATADPHRGRFRAFLLTACKNFITNEWERARTQKRGGGRIRLSLDAVLDACHFEPVDAWTAERLYDRQWTLTLLEQVLDRLRAEHVESGKGEIFEQLKPFLAGTPPGTAQAAAARALGLTEGAFKTALHRLRRRYRDLLRTEVAHTVDADANVDDEIRALLHALG
jgi:RNA polymerase sigma-70 factor (ECF subfamily)